MPALWKHKPGDVYEFKVSLVLIANFMPTRLHTKILSQNANAVHAISLDIASMSYKKNVINIYLGPNDK